jgi:hypothetical protein
VNNSVKFLHACKWVAVTEYGNSMGDKRFHGFIDLRVSLDKHGLYVTSDDVPGLHLLLPVFGDSKPTIESAIKRLFKDNKNLDVYVFWKVPQTTARAPTIEATPVEPH